tara:strand:+ start:1401 stop:1553 length:153 start_codon:yes stop_codon:yes gene_type:complete
VVIWLGCPHLMMGKNIGGAKGAMAKHNFFEEVIKLIKTMKELLENGNSRN